MVHPSWLLYHTTGNDSPVAEVTLVTMISVVVIFPTLTEMVETYVLFGNCGDFGAGDTLTLMPAHHVVSSQNISLLSFLL